MVVKNRYPEVWVDLDGVVYHWDKTARYLIERYHGIKLGPSTHWDYIKEQVPPEVWKWLWSEGISLGLFRHGHLVKGAKDGLESLLYLGTRLVAATARPFSRRVITDTWAMISYHDLPFHEVRIVGDSKEKVSAVVASQANFLIEDNLETVNSLTNHDHVLPILLNRPWNQGEIRPDVVRVENWPGIVKLVGDFAMGVTRGKDGN